MIDWLLSPGDPSRPHLIVEASAWHARFMTIAWAVLLPIGVLLARFFKIWPGQNWPAQCDVRHWWRGHLILQYLGAALMVVALDALWSGFLPLSPIVTKAYSKTYLDLHVYLGVSALALLVSQFISGWLRGSTGGPQDKILRGHHYDMTLRRRVFERVHKSFGYVAILLAWAAMALGFWTVNAPRWMWIGVGLWWAFLILVFIVLQRQGRCLDTYQAIWGPDPGLPGAKTRPIGFGVRRIPVSNDPSRDK